MEKVTNPLRERIEIDLFDRSDPLTAAVVGV
jgi:hypothetical protein